jgi:acyl-coenzyme A synthetase/AMP-(fatty) acid ligase
MRQVPDALSRYKLKLRAVLSGGEAVGKELFEWADRELKLKINEGFGQTDRPGTILVPRHTVTDDREQRGIRRISVEFVFQSFLR